MIPLIVLATLWVVVMTGLWVWYQSKKNAMQIVADTPPFEGVPLAPGGHWFFGHVIEIGKHGFIEGQRRLNIAYADENNGMCSFYFLHKATVSVLLSKDVKTVLNASSYRDSIWLHKEHNDNFLGPYALTALMGKEWKYYRNVIHRSFTPAALKGSQHAINNIGQTLSKSLQQAIDSSSNNSYQTTVLPLMKMATIDVFGLAALGENFGCCTNFKSSPIATAFDFLTDEYTRRLQNPMDPTSFLYWVPTPTNLRHGRERKLIRNYIAQLCASKRKEMKNLATEANSDNNNNKTTTDLLTSLLKASEEKQADGKTGEISDEVLTDCLMVLLFGGYDTTSITLAYALYLLAKNPDIQQQCVEEVTTVMKADGYALEDPATELPYTRAVILETLRLYPAAPLTTRNVETKPLQLHDKVFPKGTMLYVPIWSIQRDPRNFPQEPDQIRPDRWVTTKKKTATTDDDEKSSSASGWMERDDFDTYEKKNASAADDDDSTSTNKIAPANRDAFCAFSGGGRNCVGKNLAMREAITLLAYLVRDLKFDCVTPAYEVEPKLSSFVQKPADDMPMIITKR